MCWLGCVELVVVFLMKEGGNGTLDVRMMKFCAVECLGKCDKVYVKCWN